MYSVLCCRAMSCSVPVFFCTEKEDHCRRRYELSANTSFVSVPREKGSVERVESSETDNLPFFCKAQSVVVIYASMKSIVFLVFYCCWGRVVMWITSLVFHPDGNRSPELISSFRPQKWQLQRQLSFLFWSCAPNRIHRLCRMIAPMDQTQRI